MRRFSAPFALAALLAASAPAMAQDWGYGPGPGYGPYAGGPYPYGDRYGYGPYGYNDAGEMDIAICPRGYHLGHSGRLCWPNR